MPTLSFKPGKRRLDFAKQACLSSPGQKDCSSFHPALLSERAPWQRHSTPSPASCGVHACDDALLHSIAFTAFRFASIALLFCPVPSQTHSPVLMPGAASVGGRDKRFKAFLRGRVKPALGDKGKQKVPFLPQKHHYQAARPCLCAETEGRRTLQRKQPSPRHLGARGLRCHIMATTVGRCRNRSETRKSRRAAPFFPTQRLPPSHCFAPQPRNELPEEPAEFFKARGEEAGRRKELKAPSSLEKDRS